MQSSDALALQNEALLPIRSVVKFGLAIQKKKKTVTWDSMLLNVLIVKVFLTVPKVKFSKIWLARHLSKSAKSLLG
jgi:hypothetical protein